MKRRSWFALTTSGWLLVAVSAHAETPPVVDSEDAALIDEAAQDSMEFNKTLETTEWVNPDTGNRGTVTPTETYQTNDGTYCREFHQTVTIGGEEVQAYGTACRQPDGTWELARRTPDEEFGIEPEPAVESDDEPEVVYRDRVVYVPQRRPWYDSWWYPFGVSIGFGSRDAWFYYGSGHYYYPHRHYRKRYTTWGKSHHRSHWRSHRGHHSGHHRGGHRGGGRHR